MKKIFLTIAVLFTVLFTSCNKETFNIDDEQHIINGEWQLKPKNHEYWLITNDYGTVIYTYTITGYTCDTTKTLKIIAKNNVIKTSGFFKTIGLCYDDIITLEDIHTDTIVGNPYVIVYGCVTYQINDFPLNIIENNEIDDYLNSIGIHDYSCYEIFYGEQVREFFEFSNIKMIDDNTIEFDIIKHENNRDYTEQVIGYRI